MIADPILIALDVADALETCGLLYLVGGSLSSSLSGEPRSTLDIDLVVAMSEKDVEPLVAALGHGFYVEPEALRRAIQKRSSANLIHFASSMKVDIFVAGGTPLDREQLERRQRVLVATDPDRWLHFYAAEDILLQKLRWYRLGDEVSDRQWKDILGIIHVQADRIDLNLLHEGARILAVTDLLERAIHQAKHR